MTTRRSLLRIAAAAPAALLASCAWQPRRPTIGRTAPAQVLWVETPAGHGLVDAVSGRMLLAPRPGVRAWDGSAAAFGTAVAAGVTRVEVRDHSGSPIHQVTVPGLVHPRVIAPGGRFVALATGPNRGPHRPAGRAETTIVVTDSSGERTHLTLAGCVEPEAFSSDGTALYVLDYLPPLRPERYRVRRLDLSTGAFAALLTRDKKIIPVGAEEEMRGEGRQAVYARPAGLLFTLYTHQPDHLHSRDLRSGGARRGRPDVHAFVHSLGLDGSFAYCIDLPAPFGEGPPEGHTITIAANGADPFVVDAASGTVARLDGTALTVAAAATVPIRGPGRAAATTSADGRLFIGVGSVVHVLRAATLRYQERWVCGSAVRGLVIGPDGAYLWIGQTDAVAAIDTAGESVARVDVPGLTSVTGATLARVPAARPAG